MEYIAIIADAQEHDIDNYEELVQLYKDDALPDNSSVFRFELEGEAVNPLALLVGRGFFFENDWSADGTVSYVGPVSEVE